MNKASLIGKILIEGRLVLRSSLLIGDGAGDSFEMKRVPLTSTASRDFGANALPPLTVGLLCATLNGNLR